jgi:hypothetical protein
VELSLYEQNSLCAPTEYAKFGYATAGHMTAECAKFGYAEYMTAECAKFGYAMAGHMTAECARFGYANLGYSTVEYAGACLAGVPIKSQWGGVFPLFSSPPVRPAAFFRRISFKHFSRLQMVSLASGFIPFRVLRSS